MGQGHEDNNLNLNEASLESIVIYRCPVDILIRIWQQYLVSDKIFSDIDEYAVRMSSCSMTLIYLRRESRIDSKLKYDVHSLLSILSYLWLIRRWADLSSCRFNAWRDIDSIRYE